MPIKLIKIKKHSMTCSIKTLFFKNDVLFIEKEMYVYDRYEIMSRCAWYMGEYQLGEKATLLALESRPEMHHLQQNLKLYQEKLKCN